ncbi:MAG: hypothetical protein ACQEQG_06355 [Bacillota bacterium]
MDILNEENSLKAYLSSPFTREEVQRYEQRMAEDRREAAYYEEAPWDYGLWED